MNRIKPYSSTLLGVGGILLIGLGLYFIFLRPSLLPEDPRYMGTTLSDIPQTVPGLAQWLQKVFWVMGGYMASTGLLTITVAFTAFRQRISGIWLLVLLTGLSSIGWMVIVNFIIGSDFKWLLFSFTLPWGAALIAYAFEGSSNKESV
jgi:hypothetical protein